jgi:exopolyphosphatase / guanosine-5'-triphosphate,3'-diphosphate pyrophosphatase
VTAKTKRNKAGNLDLPLFHFSAKRKIERLGVVDVGSNSVRLVIFDGAARSPAYFFNEKILCGLGSGLEETGRLNPEGRVRAMNALKRFVLLAKNMDAGPLYSVATAAVREAEDGADFCREVKKATGLSLNVASGEEEARLSAQGVLLGWPEANGLVCDIGGSSMEMAEILDGDVGTCVTSALGPQKLARYAQDGTITEVIKARVAGLRAKIGKEHDILFLVGGSWRAIARLDMERRQYPLRVLHEYAMTPAQLLETVDWIETKSVAELRALSGSSQERMILVPVAAEVLWELIRQFHPKQIAISSYGIREGLLYEQMPEDLRRRDPLIEACRYMEHASARNPGFGKVLFEFLSPLFFETPKEQLRLIKAACLIHDVTWRAHPDYRAEVCFDNATRANLGGLDHAGRVFLGTALLNRYKNSRNQAAFGEVIALLTEEERLTAEIVGKAMRFGAMLSGASIQMMGRLNYDRENGVLELILRPQSMDLFGEVVMVRFESLARALGCDARVRVE